MDTHENAAMAICQLNGYNVNGRPLKCSWGKDRPPTGQFEGYSPAGPNSAYPQTPSAFFPQYGGGPGGPGGPMSPSGPSPGGQPFAQQQQGFGGPGMNYQQMQTPQSAGGYGRGVPPQQQQQQWGQPQHGGFGQNGFGGYQG